MQSYCLPDDLAGDDAIDYCLDISGGSYGLGVADSGDLSVLHKQDTLLDRLANDWDYSGVNERGRPLLSYYHTNGQAYHRGDTKDAFCHYFLGYFVYKISGRVSIDKLQRKRAECQDSVHELLTFSRGPPTACTAGL